VTAARPMSAREIDAGTYKVVVAAGLRHEYARHIVEAAPAHHYAIVSDADVGPHYAEPLVLALAAHAPVSVHVIPSGEAHKTRDTWARVTDGLLDAGCGRDTTVVALGGGVVGDLAGFVAATFMRGVPVVQCPTSLLAMIDASIGGKTGVDTTAGKNLVGAFHAPAAVLADVETIRTLSLAQRRAGLAEAIKHGVLADADYFARLESELPALLEADPSATLDAVARSVEIKADVVRADEREHGRRKTLNLGHTLGHALGDRIIDRVARLLREQIRSDDLIAQEALDPRTSQELHARFGGDEFCFLIPELDHPNDAWIIAERFREAVERFDWTTEDARLARKPVRVDVGVVVLRLGTVAERRPMAREIAHELLARADKLMYEAKGTRAGHVHRVGVRIEKGALLETTPEQLLEVVSAH